ncbi:MAG: hypothetical protein KDM63_09355 [Verrucomicrobiae bacterium]|nr:hypothetical protein [Verrucomicrobiae bacterium]
MFHALLDSTKVIAKRDIDGVPCEVCAEVVAHHDRQTNLLTVNLSAFLRSEQHERLGETQVPPWMQTPQTVTETVGLAEAREVANDVFSSWCRRVADAMPE